MKKLMLLLTLIFCVLLLGCGAKGKKSDIPEQEQMVEKIEKAMYEVLGDDLKKMSKHELIATMKYANKDGTGDGINYQIIKSTYYETEPTDVTGLNKDALGVLFDTESADSCEEMMIKEWFGAFYRVGEKSYLCFTESPEVTYALEYNAKEIPDSEILKMAESAKKVE